MSGLILYLNLACSIANFALVGANACLLLRLRRADKRMDALLEQASRHLARARALETEAAARFGTAAEDEARPTRH